MRCVARGPLGARRGDDGERRGKSGEGRDPTLSNSMTIAPARGCERALFTARAMSSGSPDSTTAMMTTYPAARAASSMPCNVAAYP